MTSPLQSLVFGAFDDSTGRGRREEHWERGRHRPVQQTLTDHQLPKLGSERDADLVQRIRDGESAAFEHLYESMFESLWRFAAALLGGRAGAEDAVQDVFLDLWRRRATWAVGESVRGYLFGAVRHRIGTLRHRVAVGHQVMLRATEGDAEGNARITFGTGPVAAPDIAVEEHDTVARIRRVVDGLPERQRTAVLLRWLGDLNAAEIGRQLGVSDTAVRKLLFKAERTLRSQLDDLLG